MRTKELAKFILERESIRHCKENGLPRAKWTKDPILAKYRFCNVHREDDRVTRWIARNWREPFKDDLDLWFAMVFARLFNLPSTLDAVGEVTPSWKPAAVQRILERQKAKGPIFNGAYIVSTNGHAMEKVPYLFEYVLGPLWANRKSLRPKDGDTLKDYHAKLMKYDGLGSFMAAQVVADLKYVAPLSNALDWWTFAASGPGSRRGLNRVFEYDVGAPWNEEAWFQHLMNLRGQVLPLLKGMELHAQDLQNCLCEFDKYERARLDEGTPKQLYKERA